MYNPLALFTPEILQALQQARHRYFIRQSYGRGNGPAGEKGFLFSSYTDLTSSQQHLEFIQSDPHRKHYDAENPADRENLLKAASQPAGYRIYINLLPSAWSPPPALRKKIGQFLQQHQPAWKSSAAHPVEVHLDQRFGVLYLRFSYRQQTFTWVLEDIEGAGG